MKWYPMKYSMLMQKNKTLFCFEWDIENHIEKVSKTYIETAFYNIKYLINVLYLGHNTSPPSLQAEFNRVSC